MKEHFDVNLCFKAPLNETDPKVQGHFGETIEKGKRKVKKL
jgi:hypothetical protein